MAALGPNTPLRSAARVIASASLGSSGRIGLVSNPRSRRNRRAGGVPTPPPGVLAAAPTTRAELRDVLARFAAERVELLVIDGGDGTVRDVLTLAAGAWGGWAPRLAVLPSGKTNALAIDLGLPSDWSLDQALAAAREGQIATRSPVAVARRDEPNFAVQGFLFGAGAFVSATALAQRTHRAGAFNNFAVGLALAGAVGQTLFGSPESVWRRGEHMGVRFHPHSVPMNGAPLEVDRAQYTLLASTLEHMPLGLRPFGAQRPGLKTLLIDAPPRRLLSAVPALLGGSEAAWLDRAGFHRVDAPGLDLDLPGEFVLDGEVFPAGRYRITEGLPLSFVVP